MHHVTGSKLSAFFIQTRFARLRTKTKKMSMRKEINEVIISSDIYRSNCSADEPGVTYVWNIATGNPLACYKRDDGTRARALGVLKTEFLIGAVHNRAQIVLWPLSNNKSSEHVPTRMEMPDRISSLAVSPDGAYCVAGVAEKIYVWCVSTGQLLNVIQRHYQKIVCIKFADNLTFVTGGEDNLVMVWSMTDILTIPSIPGTKKSKIEPLHFWNEHTLPVTDLYVGAGGIRARAVSSSLDQTCKFWDLATGRLLCSLKFSEGLLSVTMNMAENRLYAGGTSGKIYVMDLSQGSAKKTAKDYEGMKETNSENKSKLYFLGHQKRVTCLSVSASGQYLVSGSDDNNVKVWDTSTGQCLRTLVHKGSVTNAFILPCPPSLLVGHKTNGMQQPPTLAKDFQEENTRNVDSVLLSPTLGLLETDHICGGLSSSSASSCYPFQSEVFATVFAGDFNLQFYPDGSPGVDKEESFREKTEIIARLQKEINQIKDANNKLFSFSVERVLK